MITNAIIVVGIFLSVAAVAVLVSCLRRAPEGEEGEHGFEFVVEPVAENKRYFSEKHVSVRAAKPANPLKAHIPAA